MTTQGHALSDTCSHIAVCEFLLEVRETSLWLTNGIPGPVPSDPFGFPRYHSCPQDAVTMANPGLTTDIEPGGCGLKRRDVLDAPGALSSRLPSEQAGEVTAQLTSQPC